MLFTSCVPSPLGELLLVSDGEALCGLYFVGQKRFPAVLEAGETPDLDVFAQTRAWLEAYFSGDEPGQTPPLRLDGTAFQRAVWALLREIPCGSTVSYGELAGRLAAREGKPCSARAVGAAVGRNPVSILVPCHRVVGADGSLTGYAGGLWRKEKLLELERSAR